VGSPTPRGAARVRARNPPGRLTEGGLHPAFGRSSQPARRAGRAERTRSPFSRRWSKLPRTSFARQALANVAKYAQASRVTVRMAETGGRLRIDVLDDGIGGANPSSGSGLRGLADRRSALGGQLAVESPPGSGTRIVAELPAISSARVSRA
jgi:hypothetical protein